MALCASSVFIGALFMLCPDGTMKKSVTFVLSLVFLASVISAGGIGLKYEKTKLEPTPVSISSDELDTYTARYVYEYALKKAGIDFEEITVYTDKNDSGSIFISKISVKSAEEKGKITEALQDAAKNIEVEVNNE